MPVVNPGIRRLLASAIQRLFNGASFSAPLTHSLVPERGTGSPTFTRATTATVRDNEGVLRTAIAGEARFEGARRVRNLLTYTENFSNAAWTKTATAVSASSEIAPDGTTSAVLITDDGTVANHGITQTITPTGPSRIASVYAKAGTGSFIQFYTDFVGTDYANFDLSAGLVGNVGATGVAAIESVGDGWYRCSLRTGSSSSQYITIKIVASGTSVRAESRASAQTVNIWHPQLEDITGRADQTTPSEYVSVGVASSPYYHGSMVDGVKCFPTDLSGNPIPSTTLLGYQAQGARTNLCLQSNAFTTTWSAAGTPSATQNVIGPDGAVSAWTLTDNDGAATEEIYQAITLTAATYTVSVFVKKTTGVQASYPVLQGNSGATFAVATIDTSNGVATAWTAYTANSIASGLVARCVSFNEEYWRVEMSFTATAAGWFIHLVPAGSTVTTALNTVIDVAAQGSAVFYGAQVELGSFASSYIPTTTIAVARNADVLAYSSSGNVNYGAAHSVLCTATYNGIDNAGLVWNAALGSDVNYSGFLRLTTGAANNASIYTSESGASVYSSVAGTDSARKGVMLKYAGTRNSSGGITHAANGVVGTTSAAAGSAGSVTVIQVGCHASASHLFGNIRNVRIWQRALSSSELQAVTS